MTFGEAMTQAARCLRVRRHDWIDHHVTMGHLGASEILVVVGFSAGVLSSVQRYAESHNDVSANDWETV